MEHNTRMIQTAIKNLAKRQGAVAKATPDHLGSNSFVGKSMVPEGLTNKTGTMGPMLQVGGTSNK